MLEVLFQIEKRLPELMADRQAWQSVFVDYHAPFVERLWRQVGEHRIFLHRIHPCERSEALFHPHPWPSAMRIVRGTYEMAVGYGKGMEPPPIASTLVMSEGSAYEMVDPDGWHYVRPLGGATLSFMITGVPWKRESHKSTKALQPLRPEVEEELLSLFEVAYRK
ncbi:MAG: hypothetical protein JWO73_144 [Candidatus Taylorbacteria bacterium]|nr:hypothetical protein [Candidatus Taylorbacteria bacterium]